jgi:WD40 repeat protein/cytochrome c-type biogenesis protein CcmH/NrfG
MGGECLMPEDYPEVCHHKIIIPLTAKQAVPNLYALAQRIKQQGIKVFISYSHQNKDLVNQIDQDFQKLGLKFVVDVRDLADYGNIKEFMEKIREMDFVVMVITPKFLKSANCMYEVLEFIKDKGFQKRIIPIILDLENGLEIANNSLLQKFIERHQSKYSYEKETKQLIVQGKITALEQEQLLACFSSEAEQQKLKEFYQGNQAFCGFMTELFYIKYWQRVVKTLEDKIDQVALAAKKEIINAATTAEKVKISLSEFFAVLRDMKVVSLKELAASGYQPILEHILNVYQPPVPGAAENEKLENFPIPFDPNYQQGQDELQRKNYPGAIEAFDLALDVNPNHLEALYGRGLSHYARGDYRSAQADFQAVLQRNPNHQRAKESLINSQFKELDLSGQAKESEGDLEGALRAFEQAQQLKPQQQRIKQKIKTLQGLTTQQKAARFYQSGRQNYQGKKYAAASKNCQASLKLVAGQPDALYYHALSSYAQADYQAAEKSLQKLRQLAPEYYTVQIALKHAQAAALYQNGYAKIKEGQFTAASNAFEQGRWIRAESEAEQAVYCQTQTSEDAERLQALEQVITTISAREEYQAAQQALVLGYYQAGQKEYQQKNYPAAINAFNQALKLVPEHSEALFYRGLSYYEQGEDAAAQADFQAVLKFDPTHKASKQALAEIYYRQGQAKQSTGDLAGALQALEQAGQLIPQAPEIIKQSSTVKNLIMQKKAAEFSQSGKKKYQEKKYGAASKAFAECLALVPEQLEGLYYYGLSAYGQSDYPTAQTALQKLEQLASEAYPVSIALKQVRAAALYQSGYAKIEEGEFTAASNAFDQGWRIRAESEAELAGCRQTQAAFRSEAEKLQALEQVITPISAYEEYQAAQQALVLGYYEEGQKQYQDQNYHAALKIFNQALALVTSHSEGSRAPKRQKERLALGKVKALEDKIRQAKKAAVNRKREQVEKSTKLASLYQEGQTKKIAGDLAGAQQILTAILKQDPSYSKAKVALEEIQVQFPQLTEAAQKQKESGDLAGAQASIEKALKIAPNSPELQAQVRYLKACRQSADLDYSRVLSVQTLQGHSDNVLSAAFSADGRYLVTGSWDETAIVWELKSGQKSQTLQGHRGVVLSAAFSADGRYLVTASVDHTAMIWEVKSGQKWQTLSGHSGWVTSAVFSPDSRSLLTASADKTAIIWDVASGEAWQTLRGHKRGVNSAVFSADGCYLVTGSVDGSAIVWEVKSGQKLQTLCGHRESVNSAAFSPDDRYIVTGSGDDTAKVWAAASGSLLQSLRGHRDDVNSVSFSADGRYLVTGSRDKTAKIWHVTSGQLVKTLAGWRNGHKDSVNNAVFSPNGYYIATVSRDRMTKLWLVGDKLSLPVILQKGQQAERKGKLKLAQKYFQQVLTLEPRNQAAKTGLQETEKKIRKQAAAQKKATLQAQLEKLYQQAQAQRANDDLDKACQILEDILAQDPNHAKANALLEAVQARQEQARQQQIAKLTKEAQANVRSALKLTPGRAALQLLRRFLKVGSRSVDIDYSRVLSVQTLRGHSARVRSAAFSPDGSRVVTGSNDHTAKVWEVASGEELQTLRGHSKWVNSAAFSPDGSYVVTGSRDHTAKVWLLKPLRFWFFGGSRELQTLRGHSGIVWSAAFSPDGRYVVTAGYRTAKVWDVASGQELQTLRGHSSYVLSAAFSPDGRYIVTGSADQTAKVWEVASGQELQTLREHSASVWSAAFSPDGRRVVTASADNTAKLWEVASGKELQTLRGHRADVNSAAFSPDGRYIVTGSSDYTAKIWDVASEEVLRTLSGHSDWVRSAAFSPDGYYLVTGSLDKTAKVWQFGEK